MGQDLGHVAKRLQNGNEYKFKLRVCNAMHPEDCSQFSIPRFQKLIGYYFSNFSIKKEKTVNTFFTQMVSYDSKYTNLGVFI